MLRCAWVLCAVFGGCVGSRSTPPLTRADIHTDQLAADCRSEDLEACESLGEIYLQIDPPDVPQAVVALRSACRSRAHSCETLAQLFAREGRANDAALMRRQACALGSESACTVSRVATEPARAPDQTSQLAQPTHSSASSIPEAQQVPKRELIGTGTCFAVSADGMIATAGHVVAGVDALAVQFDDEPYLPARIVRRSSATDLALIKVARQTSSFIRVPQKSNSSLGDKVFTIGFPVPQTLGFEPKFASGTVAATTVHGEDHLLQIQIPAYPGNSGGALLTDDGRFVGVIVARERDEKFYRETGTVAQEITYAVKADYLAAMLSPSNVSSSIGRERKTEREKTIELSRRSTCKVLTLSAQ